MVGAIDDSWVASAELSMAMVYAFFFGEDLLWEVLDRRWGALSGEGLWEVLDRRWGALSGEGLWEVLASALQVVGYLMALQLPGYCDWMALLCCELCWCIH